MSASSHRIPIPAAGITLEALRLGSAPLRAVIAPPHPLYGGHLSNPVVQAIALGLDRRGVGALAINWRGVGGSEGHSSGDAAVARDDYRATLAYVSSIAGDSLIVTGYSFGAATALAVACEVVAVAPPAGMLPNALSDSLRGKRILVVAAEHDEFGPPYRLEVAFAGVSDARIAIIDGADHFFSNGNVDGIVDAVAGFV